VKNGIGKPKIGFSEYLELLLVTVGRRKGPIAAAMAQMLKPPILDGLTGERGALESGEFAAAISPLVIRRSKWTPFLPALTLVIKCFSGHAIKILQSIVLY